MIYSFNGYEFEICRAPTPRKGWWVTVTVDHAKSGYTFDTKEQAQEFILHHVDILAHAPVNCKYKRGDDNMEKEYLFMKFIVEVDDKVHEAIDWNHRFESMHVAEATKNEIEHLLKTLPRDYYDTILELFGIYIDSYNWIGDIAVQVVSEEYCSVISSSDDYFVIQRLREMEEDAEEG